LSVVTIDTNSEKVQKVRTDTGTAQCFVGIRLMTFLRMCRPIYRLGVSVFWVGILLTGIGLVVALFGSGWTALVIGIGCVAFGMTSYGSALIYLSNEVKLIDESLTAKQVSDLVSPHLSERGDDAEDTEVFLGRFGGEVDVVKKHRRAAEQGDAEAQYCLGFDYEQGFGVSQDEAEAVKRYRKAADHGHAMSQFNLGNCCFNLGNCYLHGRGATKDIGEAVKWFRKAADQNHAKAQYNLAWAYHNGKGMEKNDVEAVKWFRKAADQEDVDAVYNMGVCYADGLGVAKDPTEAVKWFRKAAEQNYAAAQYNLGLCYRDGFGVAKDEVEGEKWYRKAVEQGFIPPNQTDNI
jgi:hypothetical protein